MKKILLSLVLLASTLYPAVTFAAGGTLGQSNNTATLTSGLVGYWSLDGNKTNWLTGTTQDSSGQGNTGSLIGMSTTTSPMAGKIAQALNFNGALLSGGTYSRIQTPVTNVTSSGSISWWQKTSIAFNDNTKSVAVWGQMTSGNANPSVSFQKFTDGNLYAGWAGCSGDTRIVLAASASNWPQNQWSYYTLTWVNGGNTILYQNGVQLKTQPGTVACNVNDNFMLGNIGRLYAGTNYRGFSGSMDDVRIYNRALSAQEVQQLYSIGLATVAHSNTVALQSGLAGYWPLDGNTTSWTTNKTIDVSGNGNTGQLINMSTTTSPSVGKVGEAFTFLGVANAAVKLSTLNGLSNSTGTISGWALPTFLDTGLGSSGVVFCAVGGDNACGTSNRLYIRLNSNGVNLGIGGSANLLQPFIPTLNVWHYYTMTYNAGNYSFYVDGKFINSGTYTNSLTLTTAGIGGSGVVGSNTAFFGKIDDIRAYNRALSAQEVQQLYGTGQVTIGHSNPSVVGSGLVGNWTFDGPNTNWKTDTVADSSGQGNSGQMINMATSSSPIAGKIGQAMKFNGTTQYVNIPTVSTLQPTGPFSISSWFQINPTTAQAYIFDSYTQNPNPAGIGLGLNVEGISPHKMGVISGKNNGGTGFVCVNNRYCTATSTVSVDDGKWHFGVGLWDGSYMKLYVDGLLQGTESWANAPVYAAGNQVRIGNLFQAANTAFFPGNIDDVRTYNRALSAQEVQQLYQMGK